MAAMEIEAPVASESDGVNHGIYRKRTLIVFFLISTAVCMAIAARFAPEDWSAFRIFMAGIFGGAWSFYCLFINHMLVRPAEDEPEQA